MQVFWLAPGKFLPLHNLPGIEFQWRTSGEVSRHANVKLMRIQRRDRAGFSPASLLVAKRADLPA
jgi:hypothetical protein